MRRSYAVAVLTALTIGLLGCGSAAHRTQARSQEQVAAQTLKRDRNTAKAKAIADACMRKGGGFSREARCAIPRGHGRAFLRCAFKHKPANLHNEAADIRDLEDCGVANR